MALRTVNADFYDTVYKRTNYFRYPSWLYGAYVSSLIGFCGLKKGASVLDVGCGQGLFSYLFAKNGLKVHGIDISATGIHSANELYRHLGIKFAIADVRAATFPQQFDCIFVRSCSLYNTTEFPHDRQVTYSLFRHLKSGGTFIFAYNSNFSSRVSPKWRYHSLQDVRRHFSEWPNSEIFFLNKLTTYLLRRLSFTRTVGRLNILLSKACGAGGDVVCISRKSRCCPDQDLRS